MRIGGVGVTVPEECERPCIPPTVVEYPPENTSGGLCEGIDHAGYCIEMGEVLCYIRSSNDCNEIEFVVQDGPSENDVSVEPDVWTWYEECIGESGGCDEIYGDDLEGEFDTSSENPPKVEISYDGSDFNYHFYGWQNGKGYREIGSEECDDANSAYHAKRVSPTVSLFRCSASRRIVLHRFVSLQDPRASFFHRLTFRYHSHPFPVVY